MGDISRFEDGKKLVAYAGIDAAVSQSGDFEGTQMHMFKRGSPYLRRALYTAAGVAAFHDPELSAYYQRLRKRGKHHGVPSVPSPESSATSFSVFCPKTGHMSTVFTTMLRMT